MTKQKRKGYELGCRLAQGPRQAAPCQAAGVKSYDGKTYKQNRKHQGRWSKKNKKKANTQVDLNILQLNISGISNKKTELARLLNSKKIHIALIQESQHSNADVHLAGYTPYTCKCQNCRGIITYIRNDLTAECENLAQKDSNDIQKTTLWFQNKKFIIYNIYSPPPTTCKIDELQETVYHNTIIAGDFNGHSPQWGYNDTNRTGTYLEELHENTNLVIKQNASSVPTLLHRAHKTLSRPDLTIVSSDLDSCCEIEVLHDVGSDHRPIALTIHTKQKTAPQQRRARWNFQKANWAEFLTSSEKEFSKLDFSQEQNEIDTFERTFSSIVLEASKQHIPRGNRKNYKPFWNQDLQIAVTKRREARAKLEAHNTSSNKIAFNKASAVVKRTTLLAKREKWHQTCSTLDLRKDGRKAWTLLNNLSNKNGKTNPKPMQEGETEKKRSEILNKFFSNINKSRTDKAHDKEMLQELKWREKTKITVASIFTDQLTIEELDIALKTLKTKKSPGPDKIHNEMLQHLGPIGKGVLLHLFNTSWKLGKVPKAWKNAHITPILKKDKDPKEPKSFRPISLTSCVGKVCEKIVNRRLYWWLEDSGYLSEDQAGFRAKCRTEDHLFRLCQNIQDGYQESLHTTAVFIDLQQAYDRVWRKGLLLKMLRQKIKGNLYNWIKGFLSERTIQTRINSSLSSKRVLEDGLPQGSALSCTLFLIYINDMTQNIKSQKALYADDLVIWHTGKYSRQSARHLNQDLEKISAYGKQWKVTINPTKTVYSIFSLSPKEIKQKLDIRINDQSAKKEDEPTYLGVQLDSRLTMKKHAENLKKKASKRLSLLKRLASTNWGSDLSTLRSLYIGYIRSVLDYNQCLLLSSSQTTQTAIDRIQNNALRFICGGMRSTPTSACEIQSNVEPLSLRREKATLELKERCHRMPETNANKRLVTNWKCNNRLKYKSVLGHAQDLQQKCYLPDNRSITKRVSEIPPQKKIILPEINLKLNDESLTKKTDITKLKEAAEKTIASFPDSWIHIYTDGSAFKATVNAGYGALICFPDGSAKELSAACGSTCSNYEAELLGIQAALTFLKTTFQNNPSILTNTVIFTDARSALQAIESTNSSTEVTQILHLFQDLFTDHRARLVCQWIPSHINLPGNEKADRLAKQGSSAEQQERPISQQTAKMIIKQNYREEWMNQWARGTTGRSVFQHQSQVKRNDPIYNLPRKEQSIIFRLRTQHIPLNSHLNRINPEHLSLCMLCDEPLETVEHVLFRCPKLKDIRQQLLPPLPTISNTLYSTTEQLMNTAKFLIMATGRRAKTQKPLD